MRLAQRLELLPREEVGVRRHDGGLLGDLLLADPHRPALLRALEDVALKARLVLGRGADGGDAHLALNLHEALGESAYRAAQLLEGERLLYDRVRPGPLEDLDIDAAGEKRNGELGTVAAQRREQLEAVLRADVDVEEHDVHGLGGDVLARGTESRSLEHAIALELEIDAAEQAERGIVVDDEHGARLPGRPPHLHDESSVPVRRLASSAALREGLAGIIARVRPSVRAGETQAYASALAGLCSGLASTLTRLEAIAAAPPERLADRKALETLSSLQYALHTAGELALGIDPPEGAETAHAELSGALSDARDVTSEVIEALEACDRSAVKPLVYEWRGALFRVRLAQLRLTASSAPSARPAAEPPPAPPWGAAAATLLVLSGAAAAVTGGVLDLWPVWIASLVLFSAGLLVYRP
jgi:hypothetical protein